MANLEPIDHDVLLREFRGLLGASIREETQLDGIIVMVGGDPGEVFVRIGRSKVSIALFRLSWDGPHTPVVRPIHFATLNWRRLPASTLKMTLHSLIIAVREVRTSSIASASDAERQIRPNGCTIRKRANHVPSSIWVLFIEVPNSDSPTSQLSAPNVPVRMVINASLHGSTT